MSVEAATVLRVSDGSGPSEWTNPSVRALAGDADPVSAITARARSLLLDAIDAGLSGPPVDPFKLADLLGLHVVAQADVTDARIAAAGTGLGATGGPLASHLGTSAPLALQYNPVRPRGRLRYSLAHEIAHALFPDVAETVRHRTGTGAVPQGHGDDDWQLELLCNIAAAELLIPEQAVEGLFDVDPDIDFLMTVRARFDVSTEALLRRLVQGTARPLALVALSRSIDTASASMRVDYLEPSRTWALGLVRGARLASDSVLAEPTAVGQTARGELDVGGASVRAQVVGIPAYPGAALPRVLALVEPLDAPRTTPFGIEQRRGDVARPVADGPVVIAHVVSDSARTWSRVGVARALAVRFPDAAGAFRAWSIADPEHLQLGAVHTVTADEDGPVRIASMVAQRGYGRSIEPRLVYSALAVALDQVADQAHRHQAGVHLPRIGAGQAGGRWDLIESLIDQRLVRRGIPVTLYTPARRGRRDG